MKKLLITILLLIVPTIEAHGYFCDYTDVAKYKKIASNINYSYEYELINDDVIFHVTLVNLNEALYLKDSNGNIYNYTSNEIVVDAKSGESLIFYVYPSDKYCTDNFIYTLRIQLPTYNKFYNDPICSGIENYSLCNKWSTHNLTYEKFIQNVTNYKESLKTTENYEETIKSKGLLYYVAEFLISYYYIILIIIIVICSTIIYFRSKQDNIYK
jgi:hypothetical protein